MSKWVIALFFTITTSNFLFAQQNNLEVKGISSNLYLEHIVVPKENFYSVARLYNITAKDLAAYNRLQMENGLQIGQNIKIPLERNNFTQSGVKKKKEALVPVYHTVASGETLYRLGVNYNNVPLATLKKWNHLQSDAVIVGVPMVIGYLKVDKAQSSLAQSATVQETQVAVTPQAPEPPVEKKPEMIPESTPATKEPAPEVTEKVAAAPVQTDAPETIVTPVSTKSTINFYGGYFKNLYSQQTINKFIVNSKGSAGVFKSTSGWQDGKYYCFNNDAAPGTILKITSSVTGKSVYAKVLDAIPDIRQNAGLSLVLSNSAAEELEAGENKFDCIMNYAN